MRKNSLDYREPTNRMIKLRRREVEQSCTLCPPHKGENYSIGGHHSRHNRGVKPRYKNHR